MVDVDPECEVERLNKAKEQMKQAKVAVDMRSLYERLKKSVNLNSTASEIEFPNCNLHTLAFEQLHKKLLGERQLNLNETSHQTYRRYITGNILFLMKNKDKKY